MILKGFTRTGIAYRHDTDTKKTAYDLRTGDRVRFSTPFIRSTGQYCGPDAPTSVGPFAAGKLLEVGKSALVQVLWDDERTLTVHIENLAPSSFFPSWEV
jgi:hypothetical protein